MLSEFTEDVLVGSWMMGWHTEDMDIFSQGQFPRFGRVVEELKRGETDYLSMVKRGLMTMSDYSMLVGCSDYHSGLYELAIEDLQRQLANNWLDDNIGADPEEVIYNMQRFTKKRAKLPTVTEKPIDELIMELERLNDEQPVWTGLKGLDRMMCGVRTKELTAVGARPSVGKSAFVQQVAMEVARQGKKVLFFPLEMSEIALNKRMLARYTQIPQYEMRTGLSAESWSQSGDAINPMQELYGSGNWLVFERCNDLRVIRQLIEAHNPYMIVIDQLEQLKDGERYFKDKRERFSHMTHELQAISMDMDVAVWMACQVNRDANNSPPTLANLKESGTIEEDATNVILLHRDGEKTALQIIQCDLAKQKDGECGVIPLTFNAPRFTFYGTERSS